MTDVPDNPPEPMGQESSPELLLSPERVQEPPPELLSSERAQEPLPELLSSERAQEPLPELLSSHVASRAERLWLRVQRIVPWISLGLSIAGAVTLDRSEARGPYVAAAATFGWVVLMLVQLAHREREAEAPGALHQVVRLATTAAGQSLVQLSLFFCAPFYLQASSFTPAQLLFGGVFVLAAALTLWDPLCERVLLNPIAGPLLTAFASFVGLYAALPMLGVPHGHAVWLAAAVIGVSIPSARFVQGDRGRKLGFAMLAGVLVPVFLLIGGVRAIPPAPLRVMQAGIGTQIEARELVNAQTYFDQSPGMLYCFTAIRAPLGLKEGLEHVWSLDGKELGRIALDLRGGRRQGFRTWSRIRVSPRARGVLRCDVVTPLGQHLGGAKAQIGSP